ADRLLQDQDDDYARSPRLRKLLADASDAAADYFHSAGELLEAARHVGEDSCAAPQQIMLDAALRYAAEAAAHERAPISPPARSDDIHRLYTAARHLLEVLLGEDVGLPANEQSSSGPRLAVPDEADRDYIRSILTAISNRLMTSSLISSSSATSAP